MVLARRKLGITVGLLTAALAGLVAVQAYLLKNAVELREHVFRTSVHAALAAVPRRFEATEAVNHARRWVQVAVFDSAQARPDEPPARWMAVHDSAVSVGSERREILVACAGEVDSLTEQKVVLRFAGTPSEKALAETLMAVSGTARRELVERILGDLAAAGRAPIGERLTPARLDSALTAGFREAGINLPFAFGLLRAENDSLVTLSAERYRDEVRRSPFRVSLFPLELAPPFHALAVHFPGVRAHLWLQIWPLLLSSLLFTLVVVYCFVQAIRTIAAQQRFASQIVGFVNNMTHEFKTPISTIALASEAIGRREVRDDPETVQRYNRMIGDENRRMRAQVEKILQMAQLERGDFALAFETLDLHEILTRALDAFALQIEQRRGRLRRDLAARRSRVRGDAVHLAGVIGNLVDNAVKYSAGPPDIDVRTRDEDGWLLVTVADRGVGIDDRYRERVFEKYFRCPTGERHDVKGFGLGLSYVKLLTEAHGGRVELHSRAGEGTQVTLRLPLAERLEVGAE